MSLYRDPWAKREAWRKHPVFSSRAMLKGAFPGFGIAVVAFTIYVAVDTMVNPSPKTIEDIKKRAREETTKPGIGQLLSGKSEGS